MDIKLDNSFFSNFKPEGFDLNKAMKSGEIDIKQSSDGFFKAMLDNSFGVGRSDEIFDSSVQMLNQVRQNTKAYKQDEYKIDNSIRSDNILGENHKAKETSHNDSNENRIDEYQKEIEEREKLDEDAKIKENEKQTLNKTNLVNNEKVKFSDDENKKIVSDIKALEADLKRIEKNIDNPELKRSIKSLGKEIASLREKLEKNELTSSELVKLLNLLKEGADFLAEFSLNSKGVDVSRALNIIESVHSQVKDEMTTQNLKELNSTIDSILNVNEDIGEKSNLMSAKDISNEKRELIKNLAEAVKKLKQAIDEQGSNKALNNDEVQNQAKEKLDKLMSSFSKDSAENLNVEKLEKLINSVNKIADEMTMLKDIKISVRDYRTNKQQSAKKFLLKNSKPADKGVVKTNNSASKIENSSEVKTELFIKGSADSVSSADNNNFTSMLSKAGRTSGVFEPKDIISQIIKKASVTLKNDKSEIVIQLKPETLGKVKLKLSVSKGEVSGRLVVESNEVKNIIQNNLSELQQALEENGLALSSLDISLGNELKDFMLQSGDFGFELDNAGADGDNNVEEGNNQTGIDNDESATKEALPDWMAGNVNISG